MLMQNIRIIDWVAADRAYKRDAPTVVFISLDEYVPGSTNDRKLDICVGDNPAFSVSAQELLRAIRMVLPPDFKEETL